jgi:hypothetical protein
MRSVKAPRFQDARYRIEGAGCKREKVVFAPLREENYPCLSL